MKVQKSLENPFPRGVIPTHFQNQMVQIALFALFFLLCSPISKANTYDDIRVGLYYDDTVLTSANLANDTGSGFQFGYYENKTDFVKLGQTSETALSMVIGNNVYLSGSTYYTSAPTSSASVLGAYHVVHSKGYNSYNEALAVANKYEEGFVAWIDGDFQVRSGAFLTNNEAETHAIDVGGLAEVAGTSGYSINIVKLGTIDLIFQFDGGSSYGLGVVPDITGSSDPKTWFKNILYRGGFHYQRITRGNMTVSNILPLETYLKGVVPFEMSPSWPLEALKTQAVCARTYGAAQIAKVTHSSSNFDLCNTAHCQVYYGCGGPNTASPSTTSDRAVEETADMYLWYQNTLAGTFYSSSHGGASESVSNVWRTTSQSAYPYLAGVVDPYEHLASSINSKSSWTVTYTKEELTTLFQGKGYGIGTSVNALETTHSNTGNVIELTIHWENGKTNIFYAEHLRYTSWFNLPSIHFVINKDLPQVTNFQVDYNPGLSASGSTSLSGYAVNDSDVLSDLEGTFTLSGGLLTQAMTPDPYVISGKGTISSLTPNTSGNNATGDSGSLAEGTGVSYDLEVLTGSHFAYGETFNFNGAGWGHSIGMSQFGAYAMAHYMDYTYDYILEFYYPGTEVRS